MSAQEEKPKASPPLLVAVKLPKKVSKGNAAALYKQCSHFREFSSVSLKNQDFVGCGQCRLIEHQVLWRYLAKFQTCIAISLLLGTKLVILMPDSDVRHRFNAAKLRHKAGETISFLSQDFPQSPLGSASLEHASLTITLSESWSSRTGEFHEIL